MSQHEPVRAHTSRKGGTKVRTFSRRLERPQTLKTADFIGPLQPRERRRASDSERLWSKVEKSEGCWNWRGARERSGYGSIRFDGRTQRAHRVAWMLTHGRVPRRLHVLHKCDNPGCVRPDHLFLGTHQDNMDDKVAKGRAATGEAITAGRRKARKEAP